MCIRDRDNTPPATNRSGLSQVVYCPLEMKYTSSDARLMLWSDGDALHTVYRNALRQLKLVNALLDFSRLEAGQLVLARFQLRRPARGELWALERADLEREWTVLAGDLVAFAHASYGLELARELFPTAEPEPEVLAAVTALWDVLVARGPTAGALRTYELALLERLGTGLAIDLCAVCGRQDDLTWFDPGRGGALCARCAQGSRGHGVRPLAPSTRAYLSRLAGADLAEAGAIDATVDPADRVLAREAMHAVLAAQVGHPLRSVEFLTKLAHR